MAYTITQTRPSGPDSPVYVCKVVFTGGGLAEIPCGFFPSVVILAMDATTDSVCVWTADMGEDTFGYIAAAAGFDTQAGSTLVSETTQQADITETVNGFKLSMDSVVDQDDGTIYLAAFR
jgi:hypothetical protein